MDWKDFPEINDLLEGRDLFYKPKGRKYQVKVSVFIKRLQSFSQLKSCSNRKKSCALVGPVETQVKTTEGLNNL